MIIITYLGFFRTRSRYELRKDNLNWPLVCVEAIKELLIDSPAGWDGSDFFSSPVNSYFSRINSLKSERVTFLPIRKSSLYADKIRRLKNTNYAASITFCSAAELIALRIPSSDACTISLLRPTPHRRSPSIFSWI